MNWKETYTRIFLRELDRNTSDQSVKEHLPLWWKNTRDRGAAGLRLTEAGFDTVNEIGIETFEILYPKEMPITAEVIIFLDKFIDCPYYLTKNSIFVLGSKKAVELSLFSGDLRKFGLAKALHRTNERNEKYG